MGLNPVVEIDEEKCVNCHSCISVCPVKYCNDGSGYHINLNHDLCIGCGECLDKCTHDARRPLDDTEEFLTALEKREPIVAVIAPAVAAVFPHKYLNLNGWLKNRGVEAFFDVSFGAELTVKSYLDHVSKNNPKAVIAQPCPALVTYMEIYRPELLEYLAPAHSPMMHTIVMIREFYPQYRNHKIAVLSPCVAKKREFDEVNSSVLNVTFTKLQNHLEETGVDIGSFPEVDYTNPPAERAVLFSSPGGLLRTAQRWDNGIENVSRKIEGPHTVYKYLDELHGQVTKGNAPLLVDCLNCEHGCNGGTGTGNRGRSIDELEALIQERSRKMTERHLPKGPLAQKRLPVKVQKGLEDYWKEGIYDRTYVDRSDAVSSLSELSEAEKGQMFVELEKHCPEDILNCSACGYNSCEGMAKALVNGLNRKENCHHYQKVKLEKSMEDLKKRSMKDSEISEISSSTSDISGRISNFAASIEQISASINEIAQGAQSANNIAQSGVETSTGARELVQELNESSGEIGNITGIISKIASQTHLLSLNATIEAANAGDAGKGFVVVAAEIKNLADETSRASEEIRAKVERILDRTSAASGTFENVSDILNSLNEHMSTIAGAVTEQSTVTENISNDISSISRNIERISASMERLS
ncbi:MAG: methyl-accepting chemotaxis protein [Chitinispirillaceae bacterium]